MNEEEERHLKSPAKYTQSNQEFTAPQRSSKFFVYALFLVVVLSIFFLIFGTVVLRVRAPTLCLSSVVVKDLRHNLSGSSLNATLVADIRLHNSNFGRFKFRGGNATLLYGNMSVIGASWIADGFVGRRGRREFNLTVKVSSSEKLGESDLVELRSSARLRGEVRVVRIVSRWRSAVMNCSMDLNLTSQAIQNLSCQ